jgi:phosphopantothenoylcysteine synthetase/decarboxylase
MHVIITCGPAMEPLDQVRHLTNFATGEIGTILAGSLLSSGHRVTLLRSVSSTAPAPEGVTLIPFSTNESVETILREQSASAGPVGAVLHAAALADFGFSGARHPDGSPLPPGKWESRSGPVLLELTPKPKILPRLRDWFPEAILVGWKYEVDGGAEKAREAARRQRSECRIEACVLNGPALGAGYELFFESETPEEHPDKLSLSLAIVRELERRDR